MKRSMFHLVASLAAVMMAVLPLRGSSADSPGMIPASFADVAQAIRPAVVNINTVTEVTVSKGKQKGSRIDPWSGDPFGDDEIWNFFWGGPGRPDRNYKQRGLGSGFIVDKEGYVLTNNHVVEKATEIKVKLHDGKEYTAKLVGRDPRTDIAVLKIQKADALPAARLGDSESMRVGDWVVAVGSPFGLEQTVTQGIISAVGRDIRQELRTDLLEDFFQTDAAINPGNSGGPLVNLKGEVIGINTAIQTNTGSYAGVGFAIPINVAKQVYQQIREKGKVVRGWLGVSIQELTEELARNFKFTGKQGVLIADVMSGGPAERAGLKGGDIVILINGKPAEGVRQLQGMIAALPPQAVVEIRYFRDSREKTAKVKLGEREDEAGAAKGRNDEESSESSLDEKKLGFAVTDLTGDIRQELGTRTKAGVVVTSVDPYSNASEKGLSRGDLIVEVNGKAVGDTGAFKKELGKVKDGGTVVLRVERNGLKQYIQFETSKE